jgi:hypothetical protein
MTTQKSYRNGVYVAFNGGGTTNPTESDIKYFNLLKSWNLDKNKDFHFINSHDKTSMIRDTSQDETFKRTLNERLANSRTFLLITTENTAKQSKWLSYEIDRVINQYQIPIVIAITIPDLVAANFPDENLSMLPTQLHTAIKNKQLKTLYVKFDLPSIKCAINNFHVHNNDIEVGIPYICSNN